jgi:sugar phosphate isomerase/epimerase
MKISVASYSFHGLLQEGMMDVFGYLESCKYRYGLDSADIWNGFLPTLDEPFLKKIRRAMDERGMVLANLCVDGPHLWEDDPDVREQHYHDMLRYLRAAEVLGAQTVRIDAGGRDDNFTGEQLDYITGRYREYAQRAYDLGFKIGPENHWGAEVEPENMRLIYEGVNHPAFGVLLHYGRTERDSMMVPWAMHTHITWDVAQNCLDEVLSVFKQAGYQGYYSFEHGAGAGEHESVTYAVERLREAEAR